MFVLILFVDFLAWFVVVYYYCCCCCFSWTPSRVFNLFCEEGDAKIAPPSGPEEPAPRNGGGRGKRGEGKAGPGLGRAQAGSAAPHGGRGGLRQLRRLGRAGWLGMFGRVLPERGAGWRPWGKGQAGPAPWVRGWCSLSVGGSGSPPQGGVSPSVGMMCSSSVGGDALLLSVGQWVPLSGVRPPRWGTGLLWAVHQRQGRGGGYETWQGPAWSGGKQLREAATRRERPHLGGHEVMTKGWWG